MQDATRGIEIAACSDRLTPSSSLSALARLTQILQEYTLDTKNINRHQCELVQPKEHEQDQWNASPLAWVRLNGGTIG